MDEFVEGTISLKEESSGDILIITMNGRLDALTSPQAEKQVFDLINRGEHKVLFDFSGVDYLSSAGMRMLLSVAKKLKSLSGKLVISDIQPNVIDILQMAGFDHVLDIAASRKDGLQKLV